MLFNASIATSLLLYASQSFGQSGDRVQDDLPFSPPSYPSPWLRPDGALSDVYAKARDFVSQLTLLEKVNLTTGIGYLNGRCLGETGSIPRLAFPGLCLQRTPLNQSFADFTSGFPSGLAKGATWDRQLMYANGHNMGEEYRMLGADAVLEPVCGALGRFPEGGRNAEGFSPDPYLSGELIAPTIEGMQDAGVIATIRHYIANEQEHFRNLIDDPTNPYNLTDSISANLDDRTMHEVYLWPFANVAKARAGSIMASYNQINNSYASQNSYALNHLLKSELGYQGFVMTDWGGHHGGVSSALAGLDMSMPGDFPILSGNAIWGSNLTNMVVNGTLPEWRLDDACMRVMTAFYQVGRDKDRNPPNFSSFTTKQYAPVPLIGGQMTQLVNERVPVRGNHKKLNREIATASIVMLKNNGSLPLTGSEQRLAIIGEDAGSNAWGANGCRDKACSKGTLASLWGSGSWLMPYLITPENTITNYVADNTSGAISSITDNYAETQIDILASQASVALVFVSATSGEGYITFEGNYGDRNNLTLWNGGTELVQRVASICTNTIVVMHTVGPVLMDSFYNNPNITAILWSAPPGEQSGNAIIDVLYGHHNPSGKLPFTMARTRADYGHEVLYEPNNGDGAPQQDISGLDIDYRHFDMHDITPIYEFGYGLSYTTFEYSNLTIKDLNAPAYTPMQGMTETAPTVAASPIDVNNVNVSEYLFPDGIPRYPTYIYPYLKSTNLSEASGDRHYGLPSEEWLPPDATSSAPQPIHPAGGAPGGNPLLWEPVYNISLTVTNTGDRAGHEVVQLYLGLGKDRPPRVLRGFERVYLEAEESKMVTMQLLRRDVSVWDVTSQNWVGAGDEEGRVRLWVGASSRDLRLEGELKP